MSLEPERIIDHYWTAAQEQQRLLNGSSMEVEIQAQLPKLRKRGRLSALRHISALGRITYEALRFEGDGTIKNNVIARYLSAEVQAQREETPSMAVTPANYRFRYKGTGEYGGRRAYIFQVSPRHKQVGLFRGDLWIDAQTYLRLRESGRLVKNPSIFLKRVEFVRTYEIVDGVSVPHQIQTVVDTRLVGKAELTVDFKNISFAEAPKRASLDAGGL